MKTFGGGDSPIRTARAALQRLRALGNPRDAEFLQRFFKTGPGEYAEGDRFLGIRVPVVRQLARACADMPVREMTTLLASPLHEARLLALMLLDAAYDRGDGKERAAIYRIYLTHTRYINNWDLVDASAAGIVGRHLETRSRAPLDRLAASRTLWNRRIAIVATHWFIRAGDIETTLRVSARLLGDTHDLIHKATGWMLREAAKRDRQATEQFLIRHHRTMPRTMLRYAIERFPKAARLRYLAGTAGPGSAVGNSQASGKTPGRIRITPDSM